MSCLKRVSKRLKGGVAEELGGVQDSVQQVYPARQSITDACERVWDLTDFSILDELQRPIVVVLPGMYETSHR